MQASQYLHDHACYCEAQILKQLSQHNLKKKEEDEEQKTSTYKLLLVEPNNMW